MFTVTNLFRTISNLFVSNKSTRRLIKTTGDTSIIEFANTTVNTELFLCDNKQAFLGHWTELCRERFLVLPRTNPNELYQSIIEGITYFEKSEWISSAYSHCVKISKMPLGETKHTLVVGIDNCRGCNIYESLIKAMMFALYSRIHHSKSQGTIIVYGILMLEDGRVKIYKTTNVKKGPTPIIIYKCSGIKIDDEFHDIVEYIFRYAFELVNQTMIQTLEAPHT